MLSACISFIIWYGNNPKLLAKAIGEGPTGPIVMEKINKNMICQLQFCAPSSFRPSIHPIRRDFDGSETPNDRYLHHHGSDGADTLQFDSTDEYIKTVEHELDRMLEVRDNL